MPSFTPEDVQQAKFMLYDSKHEDDIIAALDILAQLNAIEAVPDMMRHVVDQRPAVRQALEDALLKLGQPAIPAIVEYLPQVKPELHVSLQSLVASFWNNADVDMIQRMMQHEDNRVRWAMAWTLAKPLRTVPPEDIGYIFEGLAEEPLTAIRWAATQSVMTLANSHENILAELIRVALPVLVDNFKYGDMNLSETSVGAIALLTTPPNPAILSMLSSSDAELQVAAIKVLTGWVQDGKTLDPETLQTLKNAMPSASWQMNNEVSRLSYVLSISFPEALEMLENLAPEPFDDDLEPTQDIRSTGELMLPPLESPEEIETSPVNEDPLN